MSASDQVRGPECSEPADLVSGLDGPGPTDLVSPGAFVLKICIMTQGVHCEDIGRYLGFTSISSFLTLLTWPLPRTGRSFDPFFSSSDASVFFSVLNWHLLPLGTRGEFPRLPKIRARAPLWWSGFLKLRAEPSKHSLRRTPRMDLDSLCVPVVWWVALFGRLGRRGRFIGLDRCRPGPQVDMLLLGGPVGGH